VDDQPNHRRVRNSASPTYSMRKDERFSRVRASLSYLTLEPTGRTTLAEQGRLPSHVHDCYVRWSICDPGCGCRLRLRGTPRGRGEWPRPARGPEGTSMGDSLGGLSERVVAGSILDRLVNKAHHVCAILSRKKVGSASTRRSLAVSAAGYTSSPFSGTSCGVPSDWTPWATSQHMRRRPGPT
jgi:hypothetical protein